jgi:3',5'-nucleoside bisphosphate phosphatase
MRSQSSLAALLCFAVITSSHAHDVATRYRSAINIPDVAGYVTLKCDFHIHTVFSDGKVWPTVRSEEAWREGLDAIAITEHIEYQPHKADMIKNHNRSHELASNLGKDLNLLVIHGSEITRSMPPGHLNAIFLTNSTLLETPKWEDAVGAAHDQGAFIFWNHPGWDRQLSNGVVVWYNEHTELVKQGKLNGIEVVNGREYYPEAHRWAIEKKLTLFSNSDIHEPMHHDYQLQLKQGDHRPLTLVFAKERSQAAIKEALFARRTVVYSANQLIGEEQFLRPIFEKSIKLDRAGVTLTGKKAVLVQISNSSDIDYQLELVNETTGVTAAKKITLLGGRTVLLELKADPKVKTGSVAATLEYRVTNLLVSPDEALRIKLPLNITVAAPANE